MTCQEFTDALDPYLDDELSILEVLRVQDHLRACDRCRAMMDAEAALHALLTADAIQDHPPPALRDRILQRVSAAESAPSASASARRRRTVSARALLAGVALVGLLLTALLVPGLRGPGDLPRFAIEVAAQHGVYRDIAAPVLDVTTTDVPTLTEWLARQLGVPIKAPRVVQPGQHLVGGRVSSVAGAPAAYLLYEWGGRRLSLFVMPLPSDRRGGSERVVDGVELYTATLHGTTVVWWADAERLYVAASTAHPTDLEAFALLCVRSGGLGWQDSDPEVRHG